MNAAKSKMLAQSAKVPLTIAGLVCYVILPLLIITGIKGHGSIVSSKTSISTTSSKHAQFMMLGAQWIWSQYTNTDEDSD